MLGLAGQGFAESLLLERAAFAQAMSPVSLKLHKDPKYLDVVLAGIGSNARVVQERSSDTSWRGKITRLNDSSPTRELVQQVAMPEMGVANVHLRKFDSFYRLEVTTFAGYVLPEPKILATGDDLVLRFRGLPNVELTRQNGSFDLRRPGKIPQSVSAPPLRSRAVAPPLGDMAVGSMLIDNRSFVQVSGPPVTLTLNNAPAKDALMALARLGGYGFVFVGTSEDPGQGRSRSNDSGGSGVTMVFRGESYAKALNSVLMASGLQGKLDGRTLLVGMSVSSKTFAPQMSKVFRLNQVDATSALNYLGSLGAKVNVANTKTVTATSREKSSGDELEGLGDTASVTSASTVVESYGAEVGPLVGLVGTADARLNTLVLVGTPKQINVAEAYLKQIDLRKRQAAVKIQILNVTLENDSTIDSSFSSKIGNTFIVSESGKAHINFGKYKPGSAVGGSGLYDATTSAIPGAYKAYVPASGDSGFNYPGDSFYSYLEAAVVSSNAKTLAQPTLLVQEGEKAVVRSGASVITGVEKTVGENGSESFSNTREDAGLTVEVEIEKIDDNGFVTLNLDPTISVPISAGLQEGRPIFDINERSLKSGRIRLRDRQTLILTGVIQEDDRRLVQKWPILGDLPLIGQLFRRTTSTRQKNELVIIVNPSILNDENGGSYGYGYSPGTAESTKLIRSGPDRY